MKLKQLTINNIASIEQAVIDFDQSPLSDERLFLITGETGSGKSTIIDCLCLALYDQTPRLSAARREKYRDNHGGDANSTEFTTGDARQLMRRGSTEASVRLTFDDNEGVPYIATWEVKRARNKADGAIQNVKRTLRTDEGVVPAVDLNGKKEVNAYLEQLIGLDMNQFFRTVVLAQGKFSEFLTSSEKDKADLLEKMTGTEIYSQIGMKIFETCKKKGNQCEILKGQIENIELLNDEQKDGIHKEIAQRDSEHKALDEQLKKANDMLQWVNSKSNIVKEIDEKTKLLDEQVAQTKSPDYHGQQALVADWDATTEARHQLKENRTALARIAELQKQRPGIQEEYDRLCAALRAARTDLENKRLQVQELTEAIQREAPNKPMYEAMERIKALLKQWHDNRKNFHDYTEGLAKDKKQLPEAKAEVKRTLDAAKDLERVINKLQARYKALNASEISKEKDAVNKAIQALETLKAKHGAVAEAEEGINDLKTKLGESQNILTQVKATIEGKRALRDKAKESLERQKGWNELLNEAQKTLHKGDTCPVCGNTILNELMPKSDSELEQLQQELDQAEADLRAAEGQVQLNERLIVEYGQEITKGKKGLEKKCEEREAHWQQTRPLLERCGKQADEMPDSILADTFIRDIEAQVEALNVKLDEASKLNADIQGKQKDHIEANKTYHQADLKRSTLVESIQNQEELIGKCTEEATTLSKELDGLLVMSDWQTRAETGDTFISQLQQDTDRYLNAVKTSQEVSHRIELLQRTIDAIGRSKANLNELTDNGLTTDVVPEDLNEQWRDLETRFLELNTQQKIAQETAEKAQRLMDEHLAKLPGMTIERLADLNLHDQEEINNIKEKHQTINDNIATMRGAIDTLTAQQADLNLKKPEFIEENPDRLEEIINDKKGVMEGLKNRIAELKAQLTADENNIKRLGSRKQELEKAEAEYEQWHQLNENLGGSDGGQFRKIAQSYILGELLASANEYLKQFNNRYELIAKPASLLILVHDLVQGDQTSVNTLSGGESFMVSLALALALSNMSGKVFSVDTLFIDEGFGSLSPIYLDNVMETLNRLYDLGGRRVGIISHVEMLKDRVPTQIKVFRSPENNTVSRVEVTH